MTRTIRFLITTPRQGDADRRGDTRPRAHPHAAAHNLPDQRLAPRQRRVAVPWHALRFTVLTLAALFAPAIHAAVYTVGPPGATAGCSHPTLQAAIDTAAATPGLDIIRIARGTYPAQHLFINDSGDLAIEGGFVACTTLVHYDYSTLDGAGANPAGPIIDHRGAGDLTLTDLHIQNGNAVAAGSTLTLGGGVSSSGAGLLTIRRSLFFNNHAVLGGGLYVATSAPPKGVTLTDVSFSTNRADDSGGGIYAQLCDMTIDGEGGSSFAGNHADGTDVFDGGGAIYATGCNITVNGRMPTAVPFMDGNWTNGSGGAIYFANTSGASLLWMQPQSGGGALEFAYNTADIIGGAINAEAVGAHSHVTVQLADAIVTHNDAPQGSAFYLYADGASSYARIALGSRNACSESWQCNRLDHNKSGIGGTIQTEQGHGGFTSLELRRSQLIDNVSLTGGSVVNAIGDVGGSVLIDNSVIADNDAGNAPLLDVLGDATVQNSTLANNIRVTPALLRATGSTARIRLHNSIALAPNATVLLTAGGASSDLRNLLLVGTLSVGNEAPRNIQYSQDPMFVNPGQRDYRIQLGSPARNRWSPGGGVDVPAIDLRGAARPAPGDTVTPYDFGAYEYGAVVDHIFDDGFEP